MCHATVTSCPSCDARRCLRTQPSCTRARSSSRGRWQVRARRLTTTGQSLPLSLPLLLPQPLLLPLPLHLPVLGVWVLCVIVSVCVCWCVLVSVCVCWCLCVSVCACVSVGRGAHPPHVWRVAACDARVCCGVACIVRCAWPLARASLVNSSSRSPLPFSPFSPSLVVLASCYSCFTPRALSRYMGRPRASGGRC